MLKRLSFLCCLLCANLSNSQDSYVTQQVDSLKEVIRTAQHDSIVINAWEQWDLLIYRTDPDLDRVLNERIDSLCGVNLEKKLSGRERSYFTIKKSFALNGLGLIYRNHGQFDKAIQYFEKSRKYGDKADDYARVTKALGNIGSCYQIQGKYDKTLEYYKKALEYSQRKNYTEGEGVAVMRIGGLYQLRGDYDNALIYFKKSLKINQDVGNINEIPSSYANIAYIYQQQGDHAQAIVNFNEARKLYEKNKDYGQVSKVLTNIGSIYLQQENPEKALDYFDQGLEYNRKVDDQSGVASILAEKGIVYLDLGDSTEALRLFKQSYEIKKSIGERAGMGGTLRLIGLFYRKQGDYDKALQYTNEAIAIQRTISENAGLANSLTQLSLIYFRKGEYQKAVEFGKEGLSLAQTLGDAISVRDASQNLYRALKKLDRSKEALEMYELYIETNNSILSDANREEMVRQEFKYTYETKALTDSLNHSREMAVLAVQGEKLTFGLIAAGIGITLMVGIAVILFIAFRNKKRANTIIQEQKHFVEQQNSLISKKNEEIVDSIKYAQRLQQAILPPINDLIKKFDDAFIFYQPKDILAGDFYWIFEKDNYLYMAVADCTGHGVPGAMVSVVCANALERCVKTHQLVETHSILDKTRELVKARFDSSNLAVNDGMDISLCRIDKVRREFQYSGANSKMWLISSEGLVEIKGDRQPVGPYAKETPFASEIIAYEEGSWIYMTSDGFPDQFGGERQKKFGSAQLKRLLKELSVENGGKQLSTVKQKFDQWKGELEQIDDVCVFGGKL